MNLDINECDSTPCQNKGTCADLLNGYKCSCALGFTGTNCHVGKKEALYVTDEIF